MLHRIPLAAALFAVCLPLSPPYWPYVPLLFLFLGNRRESTHKFAVFVSLFSWRSHVCERVLTLFLYISHSLLRFHQENEKVTFLRASLIGCTHRSSRSFSRPHQCPSSISIFPSLQEQHIFCFSRRETHPFYCLCDVGGWRCCWTHLVGWWWWGSAISATHRKHLCVYPPIRILAKCVIWGWKRWHSFNKGYSSKVSWE